MDDVTVDADGWCVCGMAANDPTHNDGWCKLLRWNARLFDDARHDREHQFEKNLQHRDYLAGRTPEDPQGTLAVQHTPAMNTYSR